MTRIVASKRNMDEWYKPGVYAYSDETGDECSADPADYFWLATDDVLTDSAGNQMVLVRRPVTLREYLTVPW